MIQSQEQLRARFALERVQQWKKQHAQEFDKQEEYRSYASELPMMIHTNGLGQAAAFFRSKGDKGTHYDLYKLLADWLAEEGNPFHGTPDSPDRLLQAIKDNSLGTYLAAQAEAMAFMDWVRKFARAFMEKKQKQETPDGHAAVPEQ